jgi:hypothetical protein
MYIKGTIIKTDADFENCILFQIPLDVWFEGEVEYGGIVEKYTNDSVKINGAYYFRENCVFRIR